jgi:hypothetical protein
VQERSPVIGTIVHQQRVTVGGAKTTTVWLHVPASGFAVRALVEKKFVPRDLNPGIGDPRTLGALVDYRFFTKKPRTTK